MTVTGLGYCTDGFNAVEYILTKATDEHKSLKFESTANLEKNGIWSKILVQ